MAPQTLPPPKSSPRGGAPGLCPRDSRKGWLVSRGWRAIGAIVVVSAFRWMKACWYKPLPATLLRWCGATFIRAPRRTSVESRKRQVICRLRLDLGLAAWQHSKSPGLRPLLGMPCCRACRLRLLCAYAYAAHLGGWLKASYLEPCAFMEGLWGCLLEQIGSPSMNGCLR